MKTVHPTIVAAVIAVSFSSVVFAAGPETIELPASMGNVTFQHKLHQERLNDCAVCHGKAPGKIAELGKEWAHATCKGCHAANNKGPTSCTGCHKK